MPHDNPWWQFIERGKYLTKNFAVCPEDLFPRVFYNNNKFLDNTKWENFGKITYGWERSAGYKDSSCLYAAVKKTKLARPSAVTIIHCSKGPLQFKQWKASADNVDTRYGLVGLNELLNLQYTLNHENMIHAGFADGSARSVGRLAASQSENVKRYIDTKILRNAYIASR